MRDGYYTVAYKHGTTSGHRTFRIHTQHETARFAPGKQIISYLTGNNNEKDYTGFGFVNGGQVCVWNKYRSVIETVLVQCATLLVSGNIADKAGKMYAMESGNCYVCNKTLTDPVSIQLGIGPVCRGKQS